MIAEPCNGCKFQYKCDEMRMACPEFRFFVNTGYASKTGSRWPSREIYIEIFHTDPNMTRRKFKNDTHNPI